MKNFDCRYSAEHRSWMVISPTSLALPVSMLMRIADFVRARWEKDLGSMNPLTDGTKMEMVQQALSDLAQGRIKQVSIGKGDIPVFSATEGEGKIYG